MTNTTDSSTLRKVAFRIPAELYTTIQEMAKNDTRPINSQVIVLLREAVKLHAESSKEKP
jgi:hypothetical protein